MNGRKNSRVVLQYRNYFTRDFNKQRRVRAFWPRTTWSSLVVKFFLAKALLKWVR